MKKSLLVINIFLTIALHAQQWQWAVAADSVFGNQEAKMVCRSNNDLYALLYQHGPSIINGSYLDSGSVIIKLNTGGNILWAKNYPGLVESVYADNGRLYLFGAFKDSLDFLGTTLISHGGMDIFFGALDASTGNKLWITSAGSAHNDWSTYYPYYYEDFRHLMISDARHNLFVAVSIQDDFSVGSQSLSHNGYSTFLLRCDSNGNLLQAFSDTVLNTYYYAGIGLQKSTAGIYLSTIYNSYNCPYYCTGNDILRVDSASYLFDTVAHLTSSFEYLHSWTVNPYDGTVNTNFNTGSHYTDSYCIFHYSSCSLRTFQKGMGDGYDGKLTPFMVPGRGAEIIVGGYYDNDYTFYGNSIDTLWYDNLFLIPDSFSNIVVGGVDTSSQFAWLLHSEGKGAAVTTSLASDQLGAVFCLGEYNRKYYWNNDSVPYPITFGNTTLPAENPYTRFFLAGGNSLSNTTPVVQQTRATHLSIFPNPSSGKIAIEFSENISSIEILDLFGQKIYSSKASPAKLQIDLSDQPKGLYLLALSSGGKIETRKIIIE